MTSHGYKQNEISQEVSMGTKIFKRSYKNFDDSATLTILTVNAMVYGRQKLKYNCFNFDICDISQQPTPKNNQNAK
jgi:hypothetical protein